MLLSESSIASRACSGSVSVWSRFMEAEQASRDTTPTSQHTPFQNTKGEVYCERHHTEAGHVSSMQIGEVKVHTRGFPSTAL